MNLLESRNRINKLLSIFVAEIEGATALNQTDINRISETILIPLFAAVYDYKNLKNLNTTAHANYPGIDLGDEVAKVAFQITSRPGIDKVKDTLQKFADYELYKKYDRLIIYILTRRQKSYSEAAYKPIIQDLFNFNPDQDILDYRSILRDISDFQINQVSRIQNILEANFGEGKTPLFLQTEEQFTETVNLNLLELFFPKTLYIADFNKELVSPSCEHNKGGYRRSSPREVVRNTLEQRGLKFGVDWEYYQNQIVTFRDLSDQGLPLAQIVHKDTVMRLDPEEFYSIDENHERVFKAMLGRCLQQKLYHQRVLWQYEEKLYIFADLDGAATRTEQWQGDRENKRVVYERVMKDNKPDEILRCKHLAFRTQYKRFGSTWYLLIKPEWFFSYDGYKRSFYGSENIDWLKRQEKNSQVFNHLRFIAHFLTYDDPPDFLVKKYPYPFLSFGKLLSLGSAPALDDNDWKPSKEENSGQIFMFDL